MKRSWLLWVILLALAATAFAAAPKKNQSPTRQRRDRHFLGSFSILLESLRAPPDNWYESTSIPGALEPSRLPLFIPDNWNERMSIPGAEDLALEPSRLPEMDFGPSPFPSQEASSTTEPFPEGQFKNQRILETLQRIQRQLQEFEHRWSRAEGLATD